MTGGLIVTNGKNMVWKRLFGTAVKAVSHFKVGTGTTDPVVGDTDLETALTFPAPTSAELKAISTGYPVYDLGNKKFYAQGFVAANELNSENITESGLFNNDTTPVMFCRAVFAQVSKTANDDIIIQYEVDFV